MIPNSLGVVITYLCNIRCEHCCFGCGPLKEEAEAFLASIGESPSDLGNGHALAPEEVERYIAEAAAEKPFHAIVFSGGEPTLFPKTLRAGIRAAKDHGITPRIVTNSTWARSGSGGARLLASLCEEGLTEMTLSYSDFHAKFVKFDEVYNALSMGSMLGLKIAIAITTNHDSLITADHLRQKLSERGADPTKITFFENDVIDTGRGKHVDLPPPEDSRGMAEGGCPYSGTQPVITPDRKVYACCGPPHRELDLLKMGDLSTESLSTVFRRMDNDPVVTAIRDEGPFPLLRRFDPQVTADQRMHICQSCKLVLTKHRHQMLDHVRDSADAA